MASSLNLGQSYERPQLANMWGLRGHQAISRGVYTPRGRNEVFLFVTRVKQQCLTQYRDFVREGLLFWEGESAHGSDQRIASATANGDKIYLLYRDRHHTPFEFRGQVVLSHWVRHEHAPSEFVFQLVEHAITPASSDGWGQIAEAMDDYVAISARGIAGIDREVIARNRGIAQRSSVAIYSVFGTERAP